ncbi:MAG: hypothetical protein K1X89_22825, partial [Myxococcaceae bacterium]|nr:hypothetical protein [Myxococcaceae bacterium]
MSTPRQDSRTEEGRLRARLIGKLIATYVLMSLAAIAGAVVANVALQRIAATMHRSLELDVRPIGNLKTISDMYAVNIVDTVHKTRAGTVTFDEAIRHVTEASEVSARAWTSIPKEGFSSPAELQLLAELERARKNTDEGVARLQEILRRGDKAALVKFAEHEMYPVVDPFTDAVGKLVDLSIRDVTESSTATEGQVSATRGTMAIISGMTAMMALVFVAFIVRRLARLKSVAVDVRNQTATLSMASSEISSGTADLSSRTEQQAAALEETASTMEEMTATVKQNADNARQANQLAVSSRTTAERGGQVVTRAVEAMENINNASVKISDIIDVIDEIAFQTNLLALNAAVEAARAGEQGRGFAVVASEVRSLARRTATAAQEIKALIKDSVGKVTEGSKLVRESGKNLEEIIGAAKKVADIISEISASSQEQTNGIDQVNAAVAQMDKFTQQNAAMAEQLASSSAAMAQQTADMEASVAYFSVGGEGTELVEPAAAAPAAATAAAAAPV